MDKNVGFKNLEQLLQQCFHNENLQIVDYTATKLLPAGENFGSIMVKMEVKMRRNRNSKEEVLHLIGKTPSIAEKSVVEWPLIFHKERFMYTDIFPFYRELEKEVGITEKDIINVLPNFIGYRNSLEDNALPDDDSVLLMENLIVKGFYNADKRAGMDVHHARKALTSLARFHALGIVMKQKRSSLAKKAIEQAQIFGMDFSPFDIAYEDLRKALLKITSVKKHSVVIERSFEEAKGGGSWKTQAIEPWATITHGDFWTNNMLFHKNNEGDVDDVKFVDFQCYLYNSPLKDVARFLGCSVDMETQDKHLGELLNLYYDVFIKTLKRLSCDASPFNRESFDREVQKEAISEFPMCALSIKFFVPELIDDNKSNEENVNNIVNAKLSDALIDKLLWLVKIYERMKWL